MSWKVGNNELVIINYLLCVRTSQEQPEASGARTVQLEMRTVLHQVFVGTAPYCRLQRTSKSAQQKNNRKHEKDAKSTVLFKLYSVNVCLFKSSHTDHLVSASRCMFRLLTSRMGRDIFSDLTLVSPDACF